MFLFSEEARPDSLGSAWLQNLTSDSLRRIAIQMDLPPFTFTSYFHFRKDICNYSLSVNTFYLAYNSWRLKNEHLEILRKDFLQLICRQL